ncbi:hypothetical protein [Aquimonas sp.]|jgi:hypothetical protein|uniref:hypothetical protein n=1 Tax=Aquimonas sp. TaxID=1872588 RepID=UPI0037BE6D5B
MSRRLDQTIDAIAFMAHPRDLFERIWAEALAASIEAACSVELTTDTDVAARLQPTTVRIAPTTGLFFRTLGSRLGISTQAAIALTLDGFVRRAVEEPVAAERPRPTP